MSASLVVFHIPHASVTVPQDVRASFLLTDSELAREIHLCTDHYTDELFTIDHPNATALVYPVSRLVVDPERFLDDEVEPMARHGMGVLYTHALSGRQLREKPTLRERQRLLDTYYRPHHAELERHTERALREHNKAVVIDCHSYPRQPFPFENPSAARPELCLGTDPFHTPDSLDRAAGDLGIRLGLTLERNTPFAGCLVPTRYYRQDERVRAFMLELQREVYMDVRTGEKLPSFNDFRTRLHEELRLLIDMVAQA